MMNVWLVETSTTGENNKRIGLASRLVSSPQRISEKFVKKQASETNINLKSLSQAHGDEPKASCFTRKLTQKYGQPDVIVSSGSKPHSLLVPVTMKLSANPFWVNIGKPRYFSDLANLILAQAWDNAGTEATHTKYYTAKGIPHHVSAEAIAAQRESTKHLFSRWPNKKKVLLLLGGEMSSDKETIYYTDNFYRKIVECVHRLNRSGCAVFVTNSRRTPETFWQNLKNESFTECPVFVEQDNPGPFTYITLLAQTDKVIVCADSMSMLWEAAATDKPVYALVPWDGRHKTPEPQGRNLDILIRDGRVGYESQFFDPHQILSTAPIDASVEFARVALDEIHRWLPKRGAPEQKAKTAYEFVA